MQVAVLKVLKVICVKIWCFGRQVVLVVRLSHGSCNFGASFKYSADPWGFLVLA